MVMREATPRQQGKVKRISFIDTLHWLLSAEADTIPRAPDVTNPMYASKDLSNSRWGNAREANCAKLWKMRS